MKPQIKISLASFMAMLLLVHHSFAGDPKTIESILTTHKWTLVEMLKTENDTSTNLLVFALPCEKDDYMLFAMKGTYQIMEGESKCSVSDKDSKGDGTWKFSSPDSSIIDSYEGGKKTWKRILLVNDDVLKIQFEGEGKKMFTYTYFSETGQTNDINKDLIVDNSDPSQNIMKAIREYLVSTNRYMIVNRKDFNEGVQPVKEDKNLQTVALVPFKNSRGSNGGGSISDKTKNDLIAQARKSGTQYVITGNMLNATALKAKDKKSYDGTVKFEVNILDAQSGTTFSQMFPEDKSTGKGITKLLNIAEKAGVDILEVAGAILFYNSYNYNYNYRYYFYNNAYQRSAEVGTVFSNVDKDVRQNAFDSTQALLSALSKTVNNVNEFVGETTPVKIKVNSIDGSGKKAEMSIEAGSNIHLKEGERLVVVRAKNKIVDGVTISKNEQLGEISVKKIEADVLSSCSFESGRQDIIEAYKQNPNEVLVLTTGKIPKK